MIFNVADLFHNAGNQDPQKQTVKFRGIHPIYVMESNAILAKEAPELLTVYLCDENQRDREYFGRLLTQCAKEEGVLINLSSFSSAQELSFAIAAGGDEPDILYLGSCGEGSVAVAARLRKSGCQAVLIILADSGRQVFQAFDVCALHYLIKQSLPEEQFRQVFARAVTIARSRVNEAFLCASGNTRKLIPLRSIAYFEIWKRVIVTHLEGKGTFEFYGTMEQLESQLQDKGFVRAHRSFLVNLRFVDTFQPQGLLLKTGESVPIGITHAQKVRQVFEGYLVQANISRLCP